MHRELLQEMEKIESSYDSINRTVEKRKLLPITNHITNDYTEILHKRLEQLENHNSKLETDLKHLKDSVNKYILNRIKNVICIPTCFSAIN